MNAIAPRGLIAEGGKEAVTLRWNHNNPDDITGYNIYRHTFFGSDPIKTTKENFYTDTGLKQGKTYSYTITAIDSDGLESERTDKASAITD